MMLLQKFTKDLKQEFTGYDKSSLVSDLLAGLTVTAVAIPLALAFGVGSGATAASGLITAIVAGLLISALGGAYYQISGPTGAMAAILMSIVAKYDMQGVFIATVLAGIILIVAGLLHLGKLISFIPMPVITGFTSGIAVIIALGQIDNFFGVQSQGASTLEKLLSYSQLGFTPNWERTRGRTSNPCLRWRSADDADFSKIIWYSHTSLFVGDHSGDAGQFAVWL